MQFFADHGVPRSVGDTLIGRGNSDGWTLRPALLFLSVSAPADVFAPSALQLPRCTVLASRMSFELDDIVPWGRSFEEYRRMFALSPEDLTGRLLGCGDGPASFNAEATHRDGSVVSVDPLYAFSAEAIKKRIEETHDDVLQQLFQNREDFIWEEAQSPERLVQKRLETMRIGCVPIIV